MHLPSLIIVAHTGSNQPCSIMRSARAAGQRCGNWAACMLQPRATQIGQPSQIGVAYGVSDAG